jgi:DNA-binding transcriptional MerR regulator
MWRIGQLSRMAGVSDRTLRHYDKIGLLSPAAVDGATGYRWYGAAELMRLERIRGLRRLGLSLRQIAEIVDAPDAEVHRVLIETAEALRRDLAALNDTVAAAEDRLAVATAILPQVTAVRERRLRVRRFSVEHPSELDALCGQAPDLLLTWLTGRPDGGFTAAVATARAGDRLVLPARNVVRAIVPPAGGLVEAGQDLFDWLVRNDFAVSGPTLEERLVDGDGVGVTVLEVPVTRGPSIRRAA